MSEEKFEWINGIRIPFGAYILEPRMYLDKAICDFDMGVIYDSDLLIDAYGEMGMTYLQALDWISYNTDHQGYFYCTRDSPAPRVKFPKCPYGESEDEE